DPLIAIEGNVGPADRVRSPLGDDARIVHQDVAEVMIFEVSPHLIGSVAADLPMSAAGNRHRHNLPSNQLFRISGIGPSAELLGRVERLRADRHVCVLRSRAHGPRAPSTYLGTAR